MSESHDAGPHGGAQEWIKAIKGGSWWKPRDDADNGLVRGYGDAVSSGWDINGTWKGEGPLLARFEPFVMLASVRYARESGPTVGAEGVTPHFIVKPFETDARDAKDKSPAPSFQIDGGLVAVPFAASVQLVWPGLPTNALGVLSFTLTTYGPTRRRGNEPGGPLCEPLAPLAPLGIDRWHVTRWAENGRRILVPPHAGRFRVSDSGYGVRILLHNGSMSMTAPFAEPASLAGSPDITVVFLAPATGTAAQYAAVEFYY